MSQYILTNEFQELEETSGTIVNASNVKVELSESPEFGTGVILHPRKKLSFANKLYAARALSDCGVAVIGILVGNDANIIVTGSDDEDDTFLDYLNAMFGN